MRDIYLYEDIDVLKNRLNIRDKKLLDEAEADYVTYRLKEIVKTPLPGNYDYHHLRCSMLFSRNCLNNLFPLSLIIAIPTHPSALRRKYSCKPYPDKTAGIPLLLRNPV